jgi:aldehyde:ferredoxin oxidoreductase
MQNRHLNQEKFAGYRYPPGASVANYATTLPVYDSSKWDWVNCREFYLDNKGVEQWKTGFYRIEGWDPKTGHPTRKTLEGLGLKYVADALQARNKLGSA